MKARYTGECTLIGCRVRQIQNPLYAEGNWKVQACIPVKMRPGKLPACALRRIHSRLIDQIPQIGPVPYLRKSVVDAYRISVGLDCRMMQQRNPDAVPLRSSIPGVWAVEVHL